MLTRDFSFNLPEEQIAQYPSQVRGTSRLMVLDRGKNIRLHDVISHISAYIPDGSILVLNDSRVRKARLYGTTENGGKVEFLLLMQQSVETWKVLVSRSKKQRSGKKYLFPGDVTGTIGEGEEGIRNIAFDFPVDDTYLEKYGHMPLPPYIRRPDADIDSERYQTVFSKTLGSSAAPTAGLHFTEDILEGLQKKGIEIVHVTLHVGLGTFLPIRAKHIEDHTMHEEVYEIPEDTSRIIRKGHIEKRKICAVGTTAVRTLEAAWKDEGPVSGKGKTSMYIYPGYQFRGVDMMLTNFHTPESSLLLLVSAFAGWDRIKEAYEEAIAKKYMFFSYGDAMLIL